MDVEKKSFTNKMTEKRIQFENFLDKKLSEIKPTRSRS